MDYQEKFKLKDLQSIKVGDEIVKPFSLLPGWNIRLKQTRPGRMWVGVEMTENEDMWPEWADKVVFVIRSESMYSIADWECDHSAHAPKMQPHAGFLPGWICEIYLLKYGDCMEFRVGLESAKDLTPISAHWDSGSESIGELAKEDLEDLKFLRTTEMTFYSSQDEPLCTVLVDLNTMARLSDYIYEMLRFKRGQDGQMVQVPVKSEKLIYSHLNQEIIVDLVEILHGGQFKSDYFLGQSLDYLIRMGYISNHLNIVALSPMIDYCIFRRIEQERRKNMESIVNSLKYSVETSRLSLLKKLWKIVFQLKLQKDSEDYLRIRHVLKDAASEILGLIADSTKDLIGTADKK